MVVIGKDTSFLYFGAEAEARFNVSLTRAKALTVVVAPPSSTGPLGMLQTASARLYGRLAMGDLTQPAADAATLLLRTGSDLEDLGETAWHSAHHIGYKACWQELPLALALRPSDDAEPEIFALRLAGLSPKTSSDLSVFCYQEVGGDKVLSFLNSSMVARVPFLLAMHGMRLVRSTAAKLAWSQSLAWCSLAPPHAWHTARIFVKGHHGLLCLVFGEKRSSS